MGRKLDPESDRHRACSLAIAKLMEEHGSGPKIEEATGLKQPTINKFQKHGTLGIDFADQVAAVFDTTIDGLVWKFLNGGAGAVLARNLPGWAKAVEEAQAAGHDYPYDLAAAVILPVAPRYATPEFARDLARVFSDHVRTSSVRPAVRRVGH